jgi:hypothetical protein
MQKKKSKVMKRLPPNWAENLWDSDIDEILQHWVDRLVFYTTPPPDELFGTRRGNADDIALVESRIAMWTECQRARQHGQKLMPIIHAYR